MDIEFKRRRAYNTKQIRFTGNPDTYKEFKRQVVQINDLAVCDVFHEMMVWFIEESRAGRIKSKGRVNLKAGEGKALQVAVEKRNGEK